MSGNTKEGFPETSLSSFGGSRKEINPANAGSECPVCKT